MTTRQRLKQHIGTADVTMNESMWSHLVQVVEGSCHVQTDPSSLRRMSLAASQLVPETGGHQLCQDHHLSFQGGSNELQQVGVADSGSYVHLSLEELDVVG